MNLPGGLGSRLVMFVFMMIEIPLTFSQAVGNHAHALDSGSISKIIFPISEPLDPSRQTYGSHWTLGVIDCHQRHVIYINSQKSLSEFHRFEEVSYLLFSFVLCLTVGLQLLQDLVKRESVRNDWTFVERQVLSRLQAISSLLIILFKDTTARKQ